MATAALGCHVACSECRVSVVVGLRRHAHDERRIGYNTSVGRDDCHATHRGWSWPCIISRFINFDYLGGGRAGQWGETVTRIQAHRINAIYIEHHRVCYEDHRVRWYRHAKNALRTSKFIPGPTRDDRATRETLGIVRGSEATILHDPCTVRTVCRPRKAVEQGGGRWGASKARGAYERGGGNDDAGVRAQRKREIGRAHV